MSETISQPEINHQAAVAATPTTPTPAVETAATETVDTKPAEKPADTPADRRFAQMTARMAHTARENEDLRSRLAALERAAKPAGDPVTMKPDELEQHVDQRATQKVAEREVAARVAKFDEAGSSEFGRQEFTEHCNTVAAIATPAQRGTLLAVVSDLDDGHKAIAAMADNPEEAAKILAMPPHRMALALAKLAAPAAAPAKPAVAFSKAPPPIKPVSGASKAEFDERTATGEQLVEYYTKQERDRRTGR